jgi:hypothetical protein
MGRARQLAHELHYGLARLGAGGWWCHFDDDQYVIMRNLRALLATLDARSAPPTG